MQKSIGQLTSTSRPRWRLRDVLRSLRGGPGHDGPVSDHFDGRFFFNPGKPTGRSFGDFLRWQRTSRRTPWPRWVQNRTNPRLPAALEHGQIALTFINHITFLLQFPGLNILLDPVYAQRASPFRRLGPARVRNPGIPFAELPPIQLVLVSHNHYDHLDIETLLQLGALHAPQFVTTLGNGRFLEQFGLGRVIELDWWQAADVPGANLTLTPAQHWSSRGPGNRNRTLWGGFVIRSSGLQVYFAGDTGYGGHFREIQARFGRLDLALLPIGAYEPRWFMQDQHMNPDDAVRAHLDLNPRCSIGTHFGCFQLTDEGIDDPLRGLEEARQRHGLPASSMQTLETGETRLFDWRAEAASRPESRS